jgi:hypothetical protein
MTLRATSSAAPRAHRSSSAEPRLVMHLGKRHADATLKQLEQVKHLIRPDDVFMIERDDQLARAVRERFPKNKIEFIAFPDEVKRGLALGDKIDGIAIDWERKSFSHSEAWSTQQLAKLSRKIHAHGLKASVVPWWPDSFDDGRVMKGARLGHEIAQIQNQAIKSPSAYAAAASRLMDNFRRNGLSTDRLGFEISLNSLAKADNHTGVDRSVACARAAAKRGAKEFYLYGNGQPHFAEFLRRMRG